MHKEAEIVTSASIIQDEAKFYSREYDKIMINLPELLDKGKLKKELESTGWTGIFVKV